MNELPTHARAVIIGGGIVGCSLAYHLAGLGWRDVVLLERRRLTCGTTWHAAGLVREVLGSLTLSRLAHETMELFARLEAETGQATGLKRNGSLGIATNEERWEEHRRSADLARILGIEVHLIGPREAQALYPLLNVDDVIGAIYYPNDGQVNPADAAMALAKGARAKGVRIIEDTTVTGILTAKGRATGVRTARGDIAAEVVVNCAGMWAREVGLMAGVAVPLHPCEHFYVVTEPMTGITPDLPVLRDMDGSAYYKEDAGKLLIGAFEANAKPWAVDGIPEDFCFDELPEDMEHFLPILEGAMHRIPALESAGIRKFFNGPESFTPDDRYILGEAPELRNFYVAAGFNSIGIQSSGGAGKALAEWIVAGAPPFDLSEVDIRRFQPFQNAKPYVVARAAEALGLLYAMHWPYRQFETGRNIRLSPLHERLKARGACFGEVAGWERANWFAPEGVTPRYEYSYGRQNWFACAAAEHTAARQAVALFDQSSFAKFLVQGRDAETVLQRICANDVGGAPGRVVYTQWLNPRGGIEADLTVTRLAEDRYLIVTGAAAARRDWTWLTRHVPEDACVTVADVTGGYAVLGLMGPNSRALLGEVSTADLSNAAFPFATARRIEIGAAPVWALRITYVGELGWEFYVPSEFAAGVFDALVTRGDAHGLRLAGMHALDSCRIEKAFRHWGHDITDEDTPLEAGLGFACKFDKAVAFIGRDALLRQKERGLTRRLVQFALEDPEPLLYHNEPIYRDGRLVGYLTSGNYGHTLGRAIGLGYVCNEAGVDADFVAAGHYEISVANKRYPATASLRPMYDPRGERMRA
ncbi:MAG: FAD-dependent oxidoreductase [Alphaproteobacteria bacterium]|nr:MAG: FAD-dependent oxidoreductase [Alphaproteobacteria bacterium]